VNGRILVVCVVHVATREILVIVSPQAAVAHYSAVLTENVMTVAAHAQTKERAVQAKLAVLA